MTAELCQWNNWDDSGLWCRVPQPKFVKVKFFTKNVVWVATFHSSSCVYIFVYICILKILSQSQTLKKKLQTKRYLNLKHFEREYKVNFDWTQPSRQSKEFSQLFSAQKWTFLNKKNLLKCKYFIVIWPKLLLISNYFCDSTSFH